MPFAPDSISLLLGIVLLGGLSTFGFLARKAFGDLTDGLKMANAKLDGLAVALQTASVEVAVMRMRLEHLENEASQFRMDLSRLKEALTQ